MKDNNSIVSENTIFMDSKKNKVTSPPPAKNGKKFKAKKHILNFFKTSFLLATSTLPVVGFMGYGRVKAANYEKNNIIFKNNKVEEDIAYYGGDTRYISNIYNYFYFGKNNLYNHFNIGENRPIKVGFCKEISENQKEQFSYSFNYLNQIFSIINPKYSFVFVNSNSEKDCDIFVDYKILGKNNGKDIGARTVWDSNWANNCCIDSAKIVFNSSIQLNNTQLRFYMLHEMMHVLLGSSDINEYESETFSLYNYGDVAFIISQIENAYASKDDIPTDGMYIQRPILTKEEKNSYVFLTPVDLSTLIALYGDSSNPVNKKLYIELLNKTENELSKNFGNQPFYDKNCMPTFKNNDNEFEH